MPHSLDRIARVCHEVNRAYCESQGDHSQLSWDDAPEWQRSSARMGVDLHTMGNFGPEANHISWMQQKLDEGWKYGPVKNPDTKEHPCIVPFSELPVAQQAKDFIFRQVVHSLKLAEESMSFGMALVHLKDGKKVARKGWNGTGMFVFLVAGSEFVVNRAPLLGIYPAGTEISYRPHLDLRTADGSISTWAPSNSDALAEDWYVVYGS